MRRAASLCVKNNLGIRKMRRRKSTLNDFFDLLFEVSGDFWQFGAATTVALGVFSLLALKWAVGKSAAASAATGTSLAVFQNLSWAFYLVPIMLGIFTVIFGWKTFTTYAKQNNFNKARHGDVYYIAASPPFRSRACWRR